MKGFERTKKWLLVGSAAAMLFAAACSKESSSEEAEDLEGAEIEIVVNNYGRNFPSDMDENKNPYLDYIEENTGIDVTVQVPPAEGYMERLNVLMASNDLPDMIYSPDATWFVNYVNQQALTPLTEIVEQYGQNLKKLIPEEAWAAVTVDGEIYAIPHILQEKGSEIVYVRQDWLDELGLEKPETLEEYVNVLREFKEQKNNAGFIMTDALGRISPILGAFGIQRNQWVERDGELIYSSTAPEMKEALEFLAELYDEGLLDKEFPSNSLQVLGEKVANDRVGLFTAAWWDTRGPILTNQQNNPDAKWEALEYPVGPNGHSGTSGSALVRGYNAVPVTSDNAAAVVKYLDFIVSDGFRDIFLGFENDVWSIQDGVATTDFEKHNEHLYRQMYTTVEPLDPETTKIRLDSLGLEFKLNDNVMKIADHAMVSEYNGPPTRASGQYGGQLKSMEDEIFANIIAGNQPISAFDNFVERWYKEGGQEWTDEVNEWFEEQ
ncbi:extracellular solute-binding protein [Sutcliffiella rhizosphaerae]|uniref:Lipoprotein LipO n=1 Tax=Sutcliffiella rhizosphaerae TaxID=2880967 RepID=A0ABM8YMB7_9BACI|nr:extracellular solute-binding protein [Sutcliffiella rhizosphaerae]CAG9621148.1 Lipoprotein LipO [Sutcliffiella rhizosphaerae]